jgi:hypothetical protein
MNKVEHKILLQPAIWIGESDGFRKKCKICEGKIDKGEQMVELISSSYNGSYTYANRFHKRCFMKTILSIFPEIFNELKGIKKEIMLNELEN